MTVLKTQRGKFDIPRDISYLDCAYNSPLLLAAGDAMVEGALSKRHPWLRKPDDFFDDAEKFRDLASVAFGGDPDCYAIIPSASYGTSAVARIMEDHLTQNDEIVVLDETFPSNYLPWLKLSEVTGAKLVVTPTPADQNWTQAVLDQIGPQTRLVAVPHCHWTNGARLDLEIISDAARSVNALLILEVTQSFGAMPLNIARIQPDFLIAAGYKWMLFPYGISIFYANKKWHQARPLEETWLSRDGAESFENLVNYSHRYQAGARRFEMGQKSIPSLLPGALVALRQLADWGVTNIAETLGSINNQIASVLEDVGLVPIPKQHRSPHILGASSPDGLPDDLIPALALENIFISRRGNSLRFAPHLHVDQNDLDRLFNALRLNL